VAQPHNKGKLRCFVKSKENEENTYSESRL